MKALHTPPSLIKVILHHVSIRIIKFHEQILPNHHNIFYQKNYIYVLKNKIK